jgi:DNA-binding MarR family transcriptional regulator
MTKLNDAGTSAPPEHTATRTTLWERPGFLVRRLNQINYSLFFESCKEFGVTPVQYGLLTQLSQTARGLDQTSLCMELGIDRTTMADVLKRLEKRGLIAREPSSKDRRQRIACITDDGRKVLDAAYEQMNASQMRLLDPLSPDERRLFMDMLKRLVEANNQYGRTSVKLFE